MIEYIIPTLVVVLPSAGFIAGALFANGKVESNAALVARLKRRIEQLKVVNRAVSDELTDHLASRAKSNANLTKSNAARHAKRLEKEAQERLISQARHKEMRELVGEIV